MTELKFKVNEQVFGTKKEAEAYADKITVGEWGRPEIEQLYIERIVEPSGITPIKEDVKELTGPGYHPIWERKEL